MVGRFGHVFCASLTAALCAAAAFALSVTTVQAGSLKDSRRAHDWSGFYAGVQAGYGWGSTDWTYQAGGNTADHDTDGGLFGGQIGFLFQQSGIVFGAEADIAWSDIEGRASCPNAAFDCESEIEYLGTIRGTIGLASGTMLFYGTGGYAYGSADLSTVLLATGARAGSSADLSGWAAGGGIAVAMDPNWSVRLEYLHYDFGSSSHTVDNGLIVDSDMQVDSIKIGMNFKF